jgi:hypothetical protein
MNSTPSASDLRGVSSPAPYRRTWPRASRSVSSTN